MSGNLHQVERDIASLKRQLRPAFMFGFTLFFILTGFCGDLLIGVMLDKIPLMDFLKSYRWSKLLWSGAVWMGIAWLGRQFSKKELSKKQNMLQRLKEPSS